MGGIKVVERKRIFVFALVLALISTTCFSPRGFAAEDLDTQQAADISVSESDGAVVDTANDSAKDASFDGSEASLTDELTENPTEAESFVQEPEVKDDSSVTSDLVKELPVSKDTPALDLGDDEQTIEPLAAPPWTCVWGDSSLTVTVTGLEEVASVTGSITYPVTSSLDAPEVIASVNDESVQVIIDDTWRNSSSPENTAFAFVVFLTNFSSSSDVLVLNVTFDSKNIAGARADIGVWDAAEKEIRSSEHTFAASTALSDSNDITSFTLLNFAGTIEGTDITVVVPHGTNVTALEPIIEHTGESISPTGPQDFTNPVTYTVTATDGSEQEYEVTIEFGEPLVLSGDKDITSFAAAGLIGTISGTNINLKVAYGTDITALEPAIQHTGESISPTGPQDFTNPVVYTVVAEDKSTKTYTVTVAVDTTIPKADFGIWTGTGSATAKLDAPLAKFESLRLDGKKLAIDDDYDTAEGSTIVTLSEDYLATLSNGSYTFIAQFVDGSAEVTLKVAVPKSATDELPQTGDNKLPLLVVLLVLLVAGTSLIAASVRSKRKALR